MNDIAMNDNERLEAMAEARRANNQLWMDIVRIALAHAPDETREVMRGIERYDALISALWGEIAG